MKGAVPVHLYGPSAQEAMMTYSLFRSQSIRGSQKQRAWNLC